MFSYLSFVLFSPIRQQIKKTCPATPRRFGYKSVCPLRALLSAPVPTWARDFFVSAFTRPSLQLLKSVCFFLLTRFSPQGDEIRELKKSKPDKATIKPFIDALITLKTQYLQEAGKAYVAPGATAAPANSKPKETKKPAKKPAEHNAGKKGSVSKGGGGGGGDVSRGLPPPPRANGPVMENGKPRLENLAQHLLGYSYVTGKFALGVGTCLMNRGANVGMMACNLCCLKVETLCTGGLGLLNPHPHPPPPS